MAVAFRAGTGGLHSAENYIIDIIIGDTLDFVGLLVSHIKRKSAVKDRVREMRMLKSK